MNLCLTNITKVVIRKHFLVSESRNMHFLNSYNMLLLFQIKTSISWKVTNLKKILTFFLVVSGVELYQLKFYKNAF